MAHVYRGWHGTHSPIDTTYYACKEHNASWARPGLYRAACKFKEGLRWHIWNGRTVRVLEDQWGNDERLQLWPHYGLFLGNIIPSLIYSMKLYGYRFVPYFLKKKYGTFLPKNVRPTEKHDSLYWPLSKNGEYNVKSRNGWLISRDKKTLISAMPRCGRFCGHFKFRPI
ncbi:LOW QUALITY PROTEIN: hypothetical protein Cgig2_001957 [Carnegiea gigantea]|uniref:Uncharacterized protein n=1 Tax=Carnegiea gigantea TaxID=171969 RepID=A0A9Q1JVB6_9CARY|nr:LOW QUALITY PROTEIN: hypothetical protein Cgig2_001957 [Carnegiea gigantea]